MTEIESHVSRLADENTTFTVKSGRDQIDWTVTTDYLGLQQVPTPRNEFLGIKDFSLRGAIKNSDLPLAALFLNLLFPEGEWKRFNEIMNYKIMKHNTGGSNRSSSSTSGNSSKRGHRKVKAFTDKEFLIGLALMIGAADCSEKGENLWTERSTKKWKRHWRSVASQTNFGKFMRFYRFKQFKRFVTLIWQVEERQQRKNDDPWWQFRDAINMFNQIRRDFVLPSEIIAMDESMSAFRPQTTKTGGLPNISYIMRKPENLGTEFKCVVCPVTGVMMFLEIQMGKDLMRHTKYQQELGATAACGLRLSEGVTRRTGSDPVELVLGDSWFGSVKASVAQSKAGFECCFQVKQNHALFPKQDIENILKDAPGGASVVLTGCHPTGVELISLGYKYNKKTVLNFIFTSNAGSTVNGDPYEMKWTDKHGNVHIRKVPRPEIVSKFFQHSNCVDVHNHLRQYCLKLEKRWVTMDCWFRLFTTLLGINVVDTFRLASFHGILSQNRLNIDNDIDSDANGYSMKKFAGILSMQLLYMAYNLNPAGKRVNHPLNQRKNKNEDNIGKGGRGKTAGDTTAFLDDQTDPGNDGEYNIGEEYGFQIVDGHDLSSVSDYHLHSIDGNGDSDKSIHCQASVPATTTTARIPSSIIGSQGSSEKQPVVVDMLTDYGGCSHTAVKLEKTVSEGDSTYGKKYINARQCVLCKKNVSRVKCLECNYVYCYPLRDKEKVQQSCFYKHVNKKSGRSHKCCSY